MATTPLVLLAIASVLLASLPYHGVSAPTPTPTAESPVPETVGAPSPAVADDGCLAALTNMSDCLSFVQDGSKLKKPDKGCCPELATLVDNNPICLCQLLGNSDSIGIKINLNKALKLPSLCRVTTPPVSTCSAVGVPVSLPGPSSQDSMPPNMAMTPKGSAPSPSNSADSSAGGVLSPSESKKGGSSIVAPAMTFIFAMSTLSFSIFF
ncbi:non-specific lipid transfer protein GPI-anchored 11-like [Vicia villosa]|uniref:non-specific lipid transfer protein GPI-anchored 11-like n=1 Tax=Vicia villosa TaxID=3911 RepID=UPI00273CE975|nr:non-specific lipid transfer protein GPI-anchored 11-like [Vicia villosa]